MLTVPPPMPPIPGFALGYPQTTPSLAFGAPSNDVALTERHRPRTLDAMVGQGAAVFQLRSFAEAPASKAFLFEGPTGVGKTTAAYALANELGVSEDWGLTVIKSARADGEAVDDALRLLRHACPAGSGWKLVIVDEADLMTPKASHLWLSAIEDLPPRSVVVFTTNAPDRFPDRFLDRCERVSFESDGMMLAQDAQALIDRIWLAETGRDDAPRVGSLNVMDKDGRLSFRRAVAALDPMVREAAKRRAAMPAAPVSAPAPVVAPCVVRNHDGDSRAVAPAPAAPAPVVATTTGPKLAMTTLDAPERVTPADDAKSLRRRLRAIEEELTQLGLRAMDLEDEREALSAQLKRTRNNRSGR